MLYDCFIGKTGRGRSIVMKYGINLPNVRACADPRLLAELAHEAEDARWDGVFIFDSLYSPDWGSRPDAPSVAPAADPWIALAAMAMRTDRVRLGIMVTPLARRRPWKVARETVTLDHLSNGRLVLPVGLGWTPDGGFANVGEELDRKRRAGMLDEALAIITGLWSGAPFAFSGEHYNVQEMTFLPKPLQSPRIPVWVVGAWPREKSMRRTLHWDGILPVVMRSEGGPQEPDFEEFGQRMPADAVYMPTAVRDIAAICEYVK
jgi:alkanesulfonate monooxygenase SsuD/methylene tetrahydromethanopterin reductase-like flavin-dependent oxidoreductase (luciferase family)